MQSRFDSGVTLTKSHNYPEALKAFTAEIENNPNDFASYLNRGSLNCCLGLDEFALDDFTKVIELHTFEITGYYNRFVTYYKIGRKDLAQRDLYIALSLAYLRRGDESRSVAMLGKALVLVENNTQAHLKRAAIYKEDGNHELALNDYTGALQADQNNPTALKLRANIYHQLGREEESKQDIEKLAQVANNPSSFTLIPNVPQMTASQMQQDINLKVKEFASLRSQLYKGGYQHSTNPEEKDKVDPSLGNLDDFDQSRNDNSNTGVEGSKKDVSEHPSISIDKEDKQGKSNKDHILSQNQVKGGQIGQHDKTQHNLPEHHKKLQIYVQSAELLHDTQLIGRMSPFVYLYYNGWEQNTKVLKKAGTNPTWNESVKFGYVEQLTSVVIKIFDKENFKNDDLVASGKFKIADILGEKVLILAYNNHLAAKLKTKVSIV